MAPVALLNKTETHTHMLRLVKRQLCLATSSANGGAVVKKMAKRKIVARGGHHARVIITTREDGFPQRLVGRDC